MKIEWVRVARRPDWPWWSVLLPVLWFALGAANVFLGAAVGRPVRLCLFKRFTGCPCPTCGFTRGLLAFLHGHPIQAWLYNPLLFSFLAVLVAVISVRMLSGRNLRLHLTRPERTAAWIVLSLIFVANWLYVIRWTG